MLLILGALMLGSASPRVAAAETAVEVPEANTESQGKQAADSGGVVEESDEGAEADVNKPEAVFASGCVNRPGQIRTLNLRARGTILYRVVPSPFFDVTLRVTYVGLRSFYVDRFFAGGTEAIRIRGPRGFWPVRIAIGGFAGSTGCFAFSATP